MTKRLLSDRLHYAARAGCCQSRARHDDQSDRSEKVTVGPSADPTPEVRPVAARARLLCAAVEAFAAKGFNGTTTRDIANGAQMSSAAVYVHFRSKEELLFEISDAGHRAILAAIDDAGIPPPMGADGVDGAGHVGGRADWYPFPVLRAASASAAAHSSSGLLTPHPSHNHPHLSLDRTDATGVQPVETIG